MGRWQMDSPECRELWKRRQGGATYAALGDAFGVTRESIFWIIRQRGGVPPRPRHRARTTLTRVDREEISRGRRPARRMRRSPGSYSGRPRRSLGKSIGTAAQRGTAVIARIGGRGSGRVGRSPAGSRPIRGYAASWRATSRRTGRRGRLPRGCAARTRIIAPCRSRTRRSISACLCKRAGASNAASCAICGGASLRHPRGRRRPPVEHIPDLVSIRERPASADDRAIPGHWEGDLLSGKGHSRIATLVERHSRYVMLVRFPRADSPSVVRALARDPYLAGASAQSLTWDRGREMAAHRTFTVATNVRVYFCDPRSPWQRGSNENTNGLLRQYFPKGTDLSHFTQPQLNAIARRLNTRPRKTLGWDTPAAKLAACVAPTA